MRDQYINMLLSNDIWYLLQLPKPMTRIEHVFYRPRVGPIDVPGLVLLLKVLVEAALLEVFDEDVSIHVGLVAKLINDLLGLAIDALNFIHYLGLLLAVVIV